VESTLLAGGQPKKKEMEILGIQLEDMQIEEGRFG
jgi:hypothetical protein